MCLIKCRYGEGEGGGGGVILIYPLYFNFVTS